jgi:hypothetical protein
MLLASSAFGAVSLSVVGQTMVGQNVVIDDPSGDTVLNFYLANPDGTNMNGFSLKATLVPPGSVSIISRAYPDAVITDANDPSNVVGKMLDAVNDLGGTGAPFTGNPAAMINVLTLGIHASVLPVTVSLALSGNDADFNEVPIGSVAYELVVPEPASMILLAAGAAFFARRRRTA